METEEKQIIPTSLQEESDLIEISRTIMINKIFC